MIDLTQCAAGPWHYDENDDPIIDDDYLGLWRNEPDDGDWRFFVCRYESGMWDTDGLPVSLQGNPWLVAWAEIREPEESDK